MTKEDKRRKELIEQAFELDFELGYIEGVLQDLVKEIQDLKPTKKELKEGLDVLINSYGIL